MKPLSHRKANRSARIRDRIFSISIIFYLILLAVTLVLGHFVDIDALETLQITPAGFLAGLVATLPALGLIAWMANSKAGWLHELRRFVQTRLVPLLSGLSFGRLVALTALVGVVEEAFFRGFVQAGVEAWLSSMGLSAGSPWLALVLASIVFGLCHAINRTYFLFATLMGLYLGAAWILATPRNLLVPIVVHALYDLVAIIYLVRAGRRAGETADG
jgi:membrane protease YdiL (CAAX protease family)